MVSLIKRYKRYPWWVRAGLVIVVVETITELVVPQPARAWLQLAAVPCITGLFGNERALRRRTRATDAGRFEVREALQTGKEPHDASVAGEVLIAAIGARRGLVGPLSIVWWAFWGAFSAVSLYESVQSFSRADSRQAPVMAASALFFMAAAIGLRRIELQKLDKLERWARRHGAS